MQVHRLIKGTYNKPFLHHTISCLVWWCHWSYTCCDCNRPLKWVRVNLFEWTFWAGHLWGLLQKWSSHVNLYCSCQL